MQLSMKYIILYVNDVEQSKQFYNETLGLPIKMQAGSYIEFETGNTTLSMNSRADVQQSIGLNVPESTTASQTFEIGFTVDDVSSTIELLREKGVKIIKEPVTKPWGQTVAYVADPDGHYIEICSVIE